MLCSHYSCSLLLHFSAPCVHNHSFLSSRSLLLLLFTFSAPCLHVLCKDGPIYTKVSHPFGNNGTEVNVTVSLIADPLVDQFQWYLNNSTISTNSRISLKPDKIHFNPLYVSDSGKYVVNGCNNVSCANQSFDLAVYCESIMFARGWQIQSLNFFGVCVCVVCVCLCGVCLCVI